MGQNDRHPGHVRGPALWIPAYAGMTGLCRGVACCAHEWQARCLPHQKPEEI